MVIIAGGFIFSSVFLGGLIWVNNINNIIIVLLLLAIWVSSFEPLAMTIIRENSKKHQRGYYLSLFSTAVTVGLIISGLLFSFFVQMWGWKIACFLFALPGYFLAYAYLKSKKGKENHKTKVEKKIKKGYIYLFFVSFVFRSLGIWAVLSFLPIYATDYIGLKPEVSAWIISIWYTGAFIGTLISSRIIDKKQPLFLVSLSTFITIFLILGITYITQPLFVILLIGTLGVLDGIYFPSQNTWLTFVTPLNHQSKIFGRFFFVEGLSATITTSLYGWIADQSSLIYAYRFATVPLFISFILYVILYVIDNAQDSVKF